MAIPEIYIQTCFDDKVLNLQWKALSNFPNYTNQYTSLIIEKKRLKKYKGTYSVYMEKESSQ